MFFAFRLVTRRETFLPHPLLFLNLPLMSSYWSSLDDLSKIVIWTVSTNKDPMERHNWGEISKVFAKMFEHVKTIIPRKIPMKSSKKTQTVGELISFSPGSRLKYLSCGRSWVLLARVRPQDSAFNGHRAPSSLSPTQRNMWPPKAHEMLSVFKEMLLYKKLCEEAQLTWKWNKTLPIRFLFFLSMTAKGQGFQRSGPSLKM